MLIRTIFWLEIYAKVLSFHLKIIILFIIKQLFNATDIPTTSYCLDILTTILDIQNIAFIINMWYILSIVYIFLSTYPTDICH